MWVISIDDSAWVCFGRVIGFGGTTEPSPGDRRGSSDVAKTLACIFPLRPQFEA
jgi:hypothetical protein